MDSAGIEDEYSEWAGAEKRDGKREAKPPWGETRMCGEFLLDCGGAVRVDGEAVVCGPTTALETGAVGEIGGEGGGGHGLVVRGRHQLNATSKV